MIWLIADTHFGHARMMELCGRPVDFEERIHANVCRMVRGDDVLVHLGDIWLGSKEAWDTARQRIDGWPGRKILIRGNHDKRSAQWYMQHGWDAAMDAMGLEMYGKRVLLTHEPAPLGVFDLNIHGHCHNLSLERWTAYRGLWGPTHRLLALEYTQYAPVNLRTAIEKGLPAR